VLSCGVRTVDLLGLLAVAVIVAAVVADEALLLLLAGAVVALMLGADRPGRARPGFRAGSGGGVGYPTRLTATDRTVDTAAMDEQREQRTEQSSEDQAQVDTGPGDDEVVVVQQGDDLVSFQGGEEVDRRPIVEDEATAEPESKSSDSAE
jgi:hypothetical protein